MRRFVVFILITTSSNHAVSTSDTPQCLAETGSQRTEVSFSGNKMDDELDIFVQFWDNESQECVLCSPCTDNFEIRIPCSMFEDATCQDSSDKSLLDKTFGQKVVLIKSLILNIVKGFVTDPWHHCL